MSIIASATKPEAEITVLSVPWPRALSYAIFAIVTVLIFATFRDYGISWDEWLQNTYGEKLLAFYASGLTDTSAFDFSNLFLYGGFFDLTAALLNLVSPFGVYETRHLLGGLIFLAGLVGGWKLARLFAGERAGLIALICLATTPLLYGHGFINPKDSPLAWLAIWTTYFCCRFLAAPGKPSWGIVAGLGISLGLTVGTRVIGVVYMVYLAGVFALAAAARAMQGTPPSDILARVKDSALPLLCAFAIAFGIMAITWPWSVREPGNLLGALHAFTHFAFYPLVLWNGDLIPADHMPQVYLPGLLTLQLPEYVLLGMVAAALFAAAAWRKNIVGIFATPLAQEYVFVAGSALAPIIGYVLLDPTVYNGLRHFLFVVPPLVVLGAIGLDKLITVAGARYRLAGLAIGAVLALAVVRQTAMMVGLHPYEYIAYNRIIGGIGGAQNRFELDYWGTSLAETARQFAGLINKDPNIGLSNGVTARVFACGDRMSVEPFLPPGTKLVYDPNEADFYMGMTAVPCEGHDLPGRLVLEIKRLGVTIGYVRDLRPGHQGN